MCVGVDVTVAVAVPCSVVMPDSRVKIRGQTGVMISDFLIRNFCVFS